MLGTCVLPPVLSCTRLLDIEQVMAKVWKKELMKLQRPKAISSWNKNMPLSGTAVALDPGLMPNISFHNIQDRTRKVNIETL